MHDEWIHVCTCESDETDTNERESGEPYRSSLAKKERSELI